MMRACVRIRMNEQANMLTRVLRPEAEEDISRSNMNVREEDGELVMEIQADDVVALRAALNSYLRWTKLAIDTKDAIEVLE